MTEGSLTTLGARVLAFGAMLVAGVVFAGVLGPDGPGGYAVVLAMAMVLQLVASPGLTFLSNVHFGRRSVGILTVSASPQQALFSVHSARPVAERHRL